MKFFKNENGFTLVDITVALIVLLLAMSFISILFFNITKSSKSIERESQATYIATDIIETYKSLDYDDTRLIIPENSSYTEKTIRDGETLKEGKQASILDGYNVNVRVEKYIPSGIAQGEDLVKIITVTVKYKVANQEKEVVLQTSINRE